MTKFSMLFDDDEPRVEVFLHEGAHRHARLLDARHKRKDSVESLGDASNYDSRIKSKNAQCWQHQVIDVDKRTSNLTASPWFRPDGSGSESRGFLSYVARSILCTIISSAFSEISF